MIRINLLPYRAERRRARQTQFAALCVVSLLIAVAVWGTGHMVISGKIEFQEQRNQYLRDETAALERQIKELEKLRAQTDALLARKNVVENLQSTRSDVVHLLDQTLRILPEDVYLKSLKQSGTNITMVGSAQTNARVSTLIGAIRNSPWLENPALGGITAVGSGPVRQSEFSMVFSLKKHEAAAPTKPAAAKKG